MTGTLINAAAIIVGSSIGLFVHTRLPEKFTKIVFQSIGLFTFFIGIKMALETQNVLFMVISLVVGSIVGQFIHIDEKVQRIGRNRDEDSESAGYFSKFLSRKISSENQQRFVDALITAFLLYCVGAMSILGAIEDGLGHTPTLLLAKSTLDGVSAIVLAASMGIGVLFSFVPLIIFQGGITLFATQIMHVFGDDVIAEMTAVGGVLLIGLGLTMLEIKKINVINMLPSLIIAVLLAHYL